MTALNAGGGTSVTSALEHDLRVAAPRLVRFLVGRGLDRDTAADLSQETWVRVLGAGVVLPSAEDLYRYARRAAINVLIGWHRRSPRLGPPVLGGLHPPDGIELVDVAGAVEDRMALDAVWDGLARLAQPERQALLYEVVGRPTWGQREAGMWKMRRSRARTKLRALLEGTPVVVAVRRAWRSLSVPLSSPAAAVATAWGVPALAVVMASVFSPSPALIRNSPEAPATVPGRTVPGMATSPSDGPKVTVRAQPVRPALSPAGVATTAPSPAPTRPTPLVATPPGDDRLPGVAATPYEGRELRLCTTDDPVLGTQCPLTIRPWQALEGGPTAPRLP